MDTYTKGGRCWMRYAAAILMLLISTPSLLAQEASGADMPALDSGNTAWILTSSILVLLMSIPGIALFYGGLVRQKNVLSVIMQTLFIVGVVSILWIAFGYSWAFDTSFAESGNPLACVIGGFDKAFLHGITLDTLTAGNFCEYASISQKIYGSNILPLTYEKQTIICYTILGTSPIYQKMS